MHSLSSSDASLRVSVHLLDSSHGAIMQTWQFSGQDEITLGRATNCDVRVGDQHVSRMHAAVRFVDGAWMIESLGRNGLLVDNQRLENAPLKNGTVFRLGPDGPMIRIRFERVSNDSLATLEAETFPLLALQIDEDRKAREVAEIVTGEYFKELRDKALRLRGQRQ